MFSWPPRSGNDGHRTTLPSNRSVQGGAPSPYLLVVNVFPNSHNSTLELFMDLILPTTLMFNQSSPTDASDGHSLLQPQNSTKCLHSLRPEIMGEQPLSVPSAKEFPGPCPVHDLLDVPIALPLISGAKLTCKRKTRNIQHIYSISLINKWVNISCTVPGFFG